MLNRLLNHLFFLPLVFNLNPLKLVYKSISPELNFLVGEIITLAIKVHRKLGPGLLESSYKECLYSEIVKAGYAAEKEKALPLIYEEVKLDIGIVLIYWLTIG
jgi:hypothetical protein